MLVRVPTGIDGRSRRSDAGAQRIGQVFNEFEVLRTTEAASTGNDDRRFLDIGPAAFFLLDRIHDPGAFRVIAHGNLDAFFGKRRRRFLRDERVRLDANDLR